VQLQLEHVPVQGPLPIKITLYRVVQEALSNAFRHAGGAAQQVKLAYQAGKLQLVVSDAGPGFDSTSEQSSEEHLGLVGMRERVESLGGTFRIDCAPGSGTRISVRLALAVGEASRH
jgi:signal transduction histidine kinase